MYAKRASTIRERLERKGKKKARLDCNIHMRIYRAREIKKEGEILVTQNEKKWRGNLGMRASLDEERR